MRRRGNDDDARLADLQTADPMVDADSCVGPRVTRLFDDAGQRADRQCLVGFVHQVLNPPPLIVIAYEAAERRNRAVTRTGGSHRGHQPLQVELARPNCDYRNTHGFSIATYIPNLSVSTFSTHSLIALLHL